MSEDTIFLKACRHEKVAYTPIWLMRQAGRYMKEYRAIREKYSFLTMCKTPEIAAEVTLQPIKAFNLDAAIIFADILLPLEGMGIDLEFTAGSGPVIHNRIKNRADIEKLRIIEPEEDVPFLMEAVKFVCGELKGKIPLIGFSGAPFTLASYMIEGGGSRNYIETKKLMYRDQESWGLLMEKISLVIVKYLNAQIKAGAQAVQLFDSWAGCLSPEDYERFVLPYSKRVIENLIPGKSVIHFAANSATLLERMKEAGGNIIGIDWRVGLKDAWRRIGYDVGIQGNLDPVALFAPIPEIEKKVKNILEDAENRPGHIFNLGHGILPQTPTDSVAAVINAVHEYSRR